jgi:hypothetical protein
MNVDAGAHGARRLLIEGQTGGRTWRQKDAQVQEHHGFKARTNGGRERLLSRMRCKGEWKRKDPGPSDFPEEIRGGDGRRLTSCLVHASDKPWPDFSGEKAGFLAGRAEKRFTNTVRSITDSRTKPSGIGKIPLPAASLNRCASPCTPYQLQACSA